MNNVNNLMELSVETMFVNAALKTNVKINQVLKFANNIQKILHVIKEKEKELQINISTNTI